MDLTSTDSELVVGLKNDDMLAFTILYKRYSGKMYIKIHKIVKDSFIVEEMIQVLFLKIWNHRGQLSNDCNLPAYIYRSAANLICDFYRKEKLDKVLADHLRDIVAVEYTHVEEHIFLKESQHLVQRALSILSPQQRNVFKLCKLEGYTYKKAANELGISPYTVKEYLCIAKNQVKEYVSTHLDD